MLARMDGLRAVDKIDLLRRCRGEDDLAAYYLGDFDELRRGAEQDTMTADSLGISWLHYGEERYPPLLRELYDPPAVLFYRGRLPDPERTMAAVVGTRKPTGMAATQAYAFGKALGEAGIPVVSGLALGIDALAHRGNIEGGGATVAVLGSGLGNVYPASNRALARRILESGGVLLSEYPPMTPPYRWNFPARNRIIAGLGRTTVVVEAPEKSGALITAQFALDLGRDVWIAQAGLVSPRGAGTAALANDGGRVISGIGPILEDWGMAVDSMGGTAWQQK
jgi:DNA processing protein